MDIVMTKRRHMCWMAVSRACHAATTIFVRELCLSCSRFLHNKPTSSAKPSLPWWGNFLSDCLITCFIRLVKINKHIVSNYSISTSIWTHYWLSTSSLYWYYWHFNYIIVESRRFSIELLVESKWKCSNVPSCEI